MRVLEGETGESCADHTTTIDDETLSSDTIGKKPKVSGATNQELIAAVDENICGGVFR